MLKKFFNKNAYYAKTFRQLGRYIFIDNNIIVSRKQCLKV